jgi:hypothetical protein
MIDSEKRGMKELKSDRQYKIRGYLAGLGCLVLLFFASRINYGLGAKPPVVDAGWGSSSEGEVVASAASASDEGGVVAAACELIYKGEFEAAGKLIESRGSQYDVNLHRLLEVVHEYRAISQRRQADRQRVYR